MLFSPQAFASRQVRRPKDLLPSPSRLHRECNETPHGALTPCRILACQPQNQLLHPAAGRHTSGAPATGSTRPPATQQVAAPAQHGSPRHHQPEPRHAAPSSTPTSKASHAQSLQASLRCSSRDGSRRWTTANLARLSAPGQPRPGQRLPHHDIDRLQHHERRPSHAARVIGTYRLAKSAVLVILSLKRNPGTRTACRPRCRGLEFTPLGGALVLRIFEDGGCSMYATGYRRLPP